MRGKVHGPINETAWYPALVSVWCESPSSHCRAGSEGGYELISGFECFMNLRPEEVESVFAAGSQVASMEAKIFGAEGEVAGNTVYPR